MSFIDYLAEEAKKKTRIKQVFKKRFGSMKNKIRLKRDKRVQKNRMPSEETLKRRARKNARRAMAKKLMGKEYEDMSYSERETFATKLKANDAQYNKLIQKELMFLRRKAKKDFGAKSKEKDEEGRTKTESFEIICETMEEFKELFGSELYYDEKDSLYEAEYNGRKVTLNKPIRDNNGKKKFKVYVKNDKGNVIMVRFGDPDLKIKKSDPERRKAFKARHNCSEKKDKTTPGYWSCHWSW